MGDAPTVVNEDEFTEGSDLEQPETTDQPAPDDVEEVSVDLEDDDLTGGDFSGDSTGQDESDNPLFDGVEGRPEQDGDDDEQPDEQDGDGDEGTDSLEGNSEKMAESINRGCARLAVVGLQDADMEDSKYSKEGLQDEFEETFAAFRLGYFGSEVANDYLLAPADGEVDPAWGLLGSLLIATALVIFLRPDGAEGVEKVKERASEFEGFN